MRAIVTKAKKLKLDEFKEVFFENVYLKGFLLLNDLTSKINNSHTF